jgi:hypothetical protein
MFFFLDVLALQILQRAFTQFSGESIMSDFMRRILESQRRGNPPASRYAIDNLEGSTIISCQTCTICQVAEFIFRSH